MKNSTIALLCGCVSVCLGRSIDKKPVTEWGEVWTICTMIVLTVNCAVFLVMSIREKRK